VVAASLQGHLALGPRAGPPVRRRSAAAATATGRRAARLEGLLFQLAGQLERAAPWDTRHPPVSIWSGA
jgi:hypothetical protein